ncbi:MAG: response regulator [Calditrichaceae bacterium]|nr:response regulator [Calditrichaceae bacterium]MBN2710599.1 response regulator [Calditrichaceae bacterium]RQV94788.1 MAG: response regulator [Calditrichota bacterium]
MGILLLIIAVVLFIIADIIIRAIIRKNQEKRTRKERQEALKVNLNLDYSHEAKTLKRVEVDNPKAKILAVDDEEIILDSFRKILVLDGYSVDTVETGQEALGLIQKRHYDFVFTDLKMPEMDGVDVCKSVKHLRPDIDVIIITGYASVDTAVETMKYGAMDYVQKPFTEDELIAMVNKFLHKRNDRIAKQLKSKVHITHSVDEETQDAIAFSIPGGVFVSRGHCWAMVDQDGSVNIGIDDFAKKIIGKIKDIDFPNLGMEVKKGQLLFSIIQKTHSIPFNSPLSGRVVAVNKSLTDDLEQLEYSAYDRNRICTIEAFDLDNELKDLKIGQAAVDFFNEDISKLHDYVKKHVTATEDENSVPADGHLYLGELESLKDKDFNAIIKDFFNR